MASAAALTLPASPSPEDKLFVICALGATPQVWHRMQALSVGWCPRIYILPRSWCPSLELSAYEPVRVVYTGQAMQIVITHGVPWDAMPFRTQARDD